MMLTSDDYGARIPQKRTIGIDTNNPVNSIDPSGLFRYIGGDVSMMIRKIGAFLLLIFVFVWFWYQRKSQVLHIVWCQQQDGKVFDITFAPNSQICASGGTIRNENRSVIYLWRVKDGTLISVLKGELGGYVSFLAFSPDGKLLASNEILFMIFGICGTQVDLLKLWKVSDNTLIKLLEKYNEGKPTFSPDGRFLATRSGLGINLWQVKGHSLIKVGRLTGHIMQVTSIAFSPDGVLLASGSGDGDIKIWRFKDGSLIHTLKGHNDWISTIAFSPNGQILVSGSSDGIIKLWRVKDGNLIQTLKPHKGKVCVSFSPNSRFLASGGEDGAIRFWKIIDGKIFPINAIHVDTCTTLAFSPNGEFLAIGDEKGFVYLFRFRDIIMKVGR